MSRGDYRQFIRDQKCQAGKTKSRILNILKKCADSRGQFSARYIGMALESLKTEGKIVSYYLTDKWSRQDKQQIDAVVFRLDGTKAILQIKSGRTMTERFKKECRNNEMRTVYVDYFCNQSFEALKHEVYINILKGWHWN